MSSLDFSFNPQSTDENAGCLVISDDIYAMLLVEPFFQSFTTKEIVDATKNAEAILALGVDSRQRVDELVDKALAVGGLPGHFTSDQGFMYGRSSRWSCAIGPARKPTAIRSRIAVSSAHTTAIRSRIGPK